MTAAQDEFRVNRISDAEIEVEDVAEGHVWTFAFAENGAGQSIIGSGHQRSPDHARADGLAGRARRFADGEAMRAGRIDRETSP